LVNPFMGTGVGGSAVGDINASPAAAVPFGMIQWGPDTAPHRASGGGYHDGDTSLSGLSLTHLSGPGCPAYGDVPILPVVGPLTGAPETMTAPFVSRSQRATPGSYSVTFARPSVRANLAVTKRTGLARFTFPPTTSAGVLLKVADSAAGSDAARAQIVGDEEITGSVTSGHFCGTPGTYTLFFDARFDRPFLHTATWLGAHIADGARVAAGPHSGAAVTFDTTRDRTVSMKVGISCGARDYQCRWLPASVVSSGARLTFVLGATPNRSWGATRAVAPPSLTHS
jgi:putative alpha-1,2-mannosidase